MGNKTKSRIWRNWAVKIGNLAHIIKAWASKKIGLCPAGNIFQFNLDPQDFELYTSGRRTIFIIKSDFIFDIGDCIRFREVKPGKIFRKETHFFIKDIIPDGSNGLRPGFVALTLE